MGSEVKFNIFLILLTNESVMFKSKISVLEIAPPLSVVTFRDYIWGNF